MGRRPIFFITMFYIMGIIVQSNIQLSKNLLMFSMIGSIIVLIFAAKKYRSYLYIPLLAFALIIGSINYQLSYEKEGMLSSFLESEIVLVGDVIDASYKNNLRLTIHVTEVSKANHTYIVKEKVITSLKGQANNPEDFLGKKVEITGMLLKPEKNRNPKMFNYWLFMKAKNTYAILYGDMGDVKILEKTPGINLLTTANKFRLNIINMILSIMPEKEGRVLLGILIGDKKHLDSEIYKDFMEVGAAHILAVSGLHVGIIYLFAKKLFSRLNLTIRSAFIAGFLLFYMTITGYAPSILRATIMIFLFILGPLVNRKYDIITSVFFTALILLIVNPLFLITTGFQLSFISVLSIACLYKPILNKVFYRLPTYWGQLASASLAAQIGTIPIIAFYFNMISPWALIINIPIIIILGYLVPLGLITIVFGFLQGTVAIAIGKIVVVGIGAIIKIADMGTALPFSGLRVVSPSMLTIIVYYFIIGLMAMEDKFIQKIPYTRNKIILAVLAIYLLVQSINGLIPGKMEITFLDVGQGDCIIIRTPMKKTILIDGGGSPFGTYDVGEMILVPYLLKNGINKVDLMIVSHVHDDHIGGLYKVLTYLSNDAVLVGKQPEPTENFLKLIQICKEKNIQILSLSKGDSILFEKGLQLNILHPSDKLIANSRDDLNNNSLVLLLQYMQYKMLFTGDIEAEAERELVEKYPHLKVDLLKIPHHGSRYSTEDEFLELVSPALAVIQVGRNNFGHPHEEVVEKIKEKNIELFRNDINGAIIITVDGGILKVRTTL